MQNEEKPQQVSKRIQIVNDYTASKRRKKLTILLHLKTLKITKKHFFNVIYGNFVTEPPQGGVTDKIIIQSAERQHN